MQFPKIFLSLRDEMQLENLNKKDKFALMDMKVKNTHEKFIYEYKENNKNYFC